MNQRPCLYCGQPEKVDLVDMWGREFMLETCCEGLHDELSRSLVDGCRDRALRDVFESHGIPCRSIAGGPELPTLQIDFGLEFAPITLKEAKTFVAEHHAHSVPPAGWKWGHAIVNGSDLVGVCTVGRPVARLINAGTTVEVNRLCVRRDLPREFTWNGCSMLYAEAAREARRRGYAKIITYTLERELGTSLLAAGWAREAMTRGGSWSRRSRRRQEPSNTGRKWRYARNLKTSNCHPQKPLF